MLWEEQGKRRLTFHLLPRHFFGIHLMEQHMKREREKVISSVELWHGPWGGESSCCVWGADQ